MIPKPHLKTLSKIYFEDSKFLLADNRIRNAFYLGGYSLELALKWKICHLHRLDEGYPESSSDLNLYKKRKYKVTPTFKKAASIQPFKTHELTTLIELGGIELRLKKYHFDEWVSVRIWNPEFRYKYENPDPKDVQTFLRAVNTIVSDIIN
ncbi:MAG: hypothetical protein JWQ09_1772 [Segetibacter sp.]|nr:hypothetical protein [Segetibacter sp.]